MTDTIKLDIKQNNQLDNKRLPNISPASQCGYTSCAMFLSTWLKEFESDDRLYQMILEIDKEFIENKSKTRKGAFQNTYFEYINSKLKPLKKLTIKKEHSGTFDEIIKSLKLGSPVFLSTMLTEHGHYVLIVGYDFEKESYIVNDPFGRFDFKSNKYVDTKLNSGYSVLYPRKDFEIVMEKSSNVATGKKGFRYIVSISM